MTNKFGVDIEDKNAADCLDTYPVNWDCTNAVVAICVLEEEASGVGAVGVPVKTGLWSLA